MQNYIYYENESNFLELREYAIQIDSVCIKLYYKNEIFYIKVTGKWAKNIDIDKLNAEVYLKDNYLYIAPFYERNKQEFTFNFFQKFTAEWYIKEISPNLWSNITHVGILYGKNKFKTYWINAQEFEIIN